MRHSRRSPPRGSSRRRLLVWSVDWIEEEILEEVPHRQYVFTLPKPNTGCKPDYVISLALPSRGPAELGIYDVTGRRVAILRSGTQEAGRNRLRRNGRTSRGRVVGPGVYFVRLKTAHGLETSRFVHLGR